ncbi:MAG: diacylglycerol kinase family protein [Anaerolineales bacterium]|nr:diacylglycerol kinase family protein [Anaerolineales bacterium]
MRAKVIYNPMAGRFPSLPLVERAADVFRGAGWDISIVKTTRDDQIAEQCQDALENHLDVVLIAGGDGSLNRAAGALMGSETALGVLPAGTANVWAQEIGLPVLNWTNWSALERSADKLLGGGIKEVDVGLCNSTPYLLWAGLGLDAFVVHHLEPRNRWEKQFAEIQYAANVAWLARRWEGMNIEIWVDDDYISGTYLLALVTNVALYAGGIATVSPGARIDDGKMDLWLFSGDTLGEAVQHIWALLSGKHIDSNHVFGVQCQQIKIKSEADLYLQVDGEPLASDKEISISIQPRALKVLIPQQRSSRLFSEDNG